MITIGSRTVVLDCKQCKTTGRVNGFVCGDCDGLGAVAVEYAAITHRDGKEVNYDAP